MINTTNPKAERAVPYQLIYDESDILKDILRSLNREAKHYPHKPMQQILDDSPYATKWKKIIGFEGRKFEPVFKIERRRQRQNQKTKNNQLNYKYL